MTGMYTIYSGTVRLKGISNVGKKVSLGELKENHSFGEKCLLAPAQWPNQFVAVTDVILLKLPAEKVQAVMKRNPTMGTIFKKQIGLIELSTRLRGILGRVSYSPEVFSEILNNVGIKNIPQGQYVYKQDEEDDRLYYLEKGSVDLIKENIEGTITLDKVPKNHLIGEEGALPLF